MHDIRNMCMTYDIIFLQETWLSKNDNALLKDIDDNFDSSGISAMNDENGYQTGRPLWWISRNVAERIHTCM